MPMELSILAFGKAPLAAAAMASRAAMDGAEPDSFRTPSALSALNTYGLTKGGMMLALARVTPAGSLARSADTASNETESGAVPEIVNLPSERDAAPFDKCASCPSAKAAPTLSAAVS